MIKRARILRRNKSNYLLSLIEADVERNKIVSEATNQPESNGHTAVEEQKVVAA